MSSVYLDHCATTPLDSGVAEKMLAIRDSLAGNPSSIHWAGRRARSLMTDARSRIAQELSVAPADLIFTASGSEANNLALKGFVLQAWPKPVHLIISAIEHDSVRHPARYLARRFENVSLIEVNPGSGGRLDPGAIEAACPDRGLCLISVMALNNETGVVQPVEEIGGIARERGIRFHCDAVQALGRIDVEPVKWGCDFLSASAHKIHGPRGAGLLYAKRSVPFDPLIHGGHQEGGRRAGTENVEALVGFAEAIGRATGELQETKATMRQLESEFLSALRSLSPDFTINGDDTFRSPGVLNLAFRGIASHDLVVGMDLAGYAISAGSACSSGVIEPSHVLQAMALEPWRVEGGVRVSFGKRNTLSEAQEAGRKLAELVQRLRAESEAISTS